MEEVVTKNYPAYIAEFIAVFGLVFVGAGAILANNKGASIGIIGIALANGFVLMCMIFITDKVSGAHVNPAVTIAMWVSNKINFVKGLFYIIAQLLGGVAAALLLKVIFSSAASSLYLGVPTLGKGVDIWIGGLVEVILTFFLVIVVFSTKDRNVKGIYIGLAVIFGILVGGGLTGAAMNPARAFGPALVSGFFINHYIYWVGPVFGGLLAALVYNKFLK